MSAPEKIALASLSRRALEALTERLLAENAALRQAIAELRAEVAQLKGVKGRPKLKPSGMEKGTEPEPTDKARSRGIRGGKADRLTMPVLLVRATAPLNGGLIVPADVRDALRAAVADLDVLEVDRNHFGIMDDPRVVERVASFLA